ncbi:PGLP2, partial [Symbiodinium necroappetens]
MAQKAKAPSSPGEEVPCKIQKCGTAEFTREKQAEPDESPAVVTSGAPEESTEVLTNVTSGAQACDIPDARLIAEVQSILVNVDLQSMTLGALRARLEGNLGLTDGALAARKRIRRRLSFVVHQEVLKKSQRSQQCEKVVKELVREAAVATVAMPIQRPRRLRVWQVVDQHRAAPSLALSAPWGQSRELDDAAARQLLNSVDVFVFDLDGVIWIGDKLVDGVQEALADLRKSGKVVVFATNNAMRTRADVAGRLRLLGVDWAEEQHVYNSAAAVAQLLERRGVPKDRDIYVVGEAGLRDEVEALGYRTR